MKIAGPDDTGNDEEKQADVGMEHRVGHFLRVVAPDEKEGLADSEHEENEDYRAWIRTESRKSLAFFERFVRFGHAWLFPGVSRRTRQRKCRLLE